MPKNRDLYLPVLVGAQNNYHSGISYQRDDSGINISHKNPNYNELTAIYWAWKNLNDVEAIGLVHYRRLFFKPFKKRTLENVVDSEDIQKLLRTNDVILPKKRNYFIESNYSHYVHAHHDEPLLKARQIIIEDYPQYQEAFDMVMNDNKAHMFNMFVMKKNQFDQYATWLFDVLEKLEKRIDISDYSKQEARVFGYVAEILMDVWVIGTNIKYAEMNWALTGKKQTFQKAYNFLFRKFARPDVNQSKTHF